jgi:hypothetical protein
MFRKRTPKPDLRMAAAVGLFRGPEKAEKVWSGADWSRERNRDPTFSVRRETGRRSRMKEPYVEGVATPSHALTPARVSAKR